MHGHTQRTLRAGRRSLTALWLGRSTGGGVTRWAPGAVSLPAGSRPGRAFSRWGYDRATAWPLRPHPSHARHFVPISGDRREPEEYPTGTDDDEQHGIRRIPHFPSQRMKTVRDEASDSHEHRNPCRPPRQPATPPQPYPQQRHPQRNQEELADVDEDEPDERAEREPDSHRRCGDRRPCCSQPGHLGGQPSPKVPQPEPDRQPSDEKAPSHHERVNIDPRFKQRDPGQPQASTEHKRTTGPGHLLRLVVAIGRVPGPTTHRRRRLSPAMWNSRMWPARGGVGQVPRKRIAPNDYVPAFFGVGRRGAGGQRCLRMPTRAPRAPAEAA